MSSFAIASSALVEIERLVGRSTFTMPVLGLSEVAIVGHLFTDVEDQLLDGTLSEVEMSELARNRVERHRDKINPSIEVKLYERSNFAERDLVETNGLTLVLAPAMRSMLAECTLIFEGERFFLVDKDGRKRTLRSLIGKIPRE